MNEEFDGDIEVSENDKTPVTIVTGFLGSGKTTLVNYILKEQRDWKICVVENEFGEVAIDNDLVEENMAAKEDIITMDNGCVCCSVRGDLVRTFAMLNNRRKDFDAIILETTGLADPAPIVFTFNSNALIQDNFRIDSVLCLVDAKHVNIHLDEVRPDGNVNEAEHQIAFADRIMLNKIDLVDNEEVEDVVDRIRSINSFAKVIRTERSRAPLDQVLGLKSFSLDKMIELDPTFLEEDPEPEHDHAGHVHDEHCGHHVHDEHCGHGVDHDHDHEHSHGHNSASEHKEESHDHEHGHEHGNSHEHDHGTCTLDHDHSTHDNHEHDHDHDKHDHGHGHDHAKKKKKVHNLSLISSVGYTIAGLLDVPKFNTFMSALLQAKAADIYRSKGVLAFADQGDTKFVFQGVHEQINFGPADKPWGENEPRISKMVFIGKNLDYEYLRESLLSCTMDPSTAQITMHKRA
jgi:G3E family GTPase